MALGLIIMTSIITPSEGDEVSKQLDIKNLEEMIVVSSIDVQIAKSNVEIAEYKLDLAEDNEGSVSTTAIETMKNESYNIDEATKDLAYAESYRDDIMESTVLEGKHQYYAYLLKEEEIQLLQSKITRLNTELAQIKYKVDLGFSVASDISDKELEIQRVEIQVSAAKLSQQEMMLKLNQYLMWDISTVIDIVSTDIPTAGVPEFDLDEIKEYQLANNYELLDLIAEKKLASEYLYILNDISDTDEDDITSAKVAINDANYDIKDKELQLALEIYTSYNELLNLRDAVTLDGLEVLNQTSNKERIEKRYAVGLETQSALNEAIESLEFAQLDLSNSNLDYYIAYEQFKALEEE
jgi:outer membrane protein TolC